MWSTDRRDFLFPWRRGLVIFSLEKIVVYSKRIKVIKVPFFCDLISVFDMKEFKHGTPRDALLYVERQSGYFFVC